MIQLLNLEPGQPGPQSRALSIFGPAMTPCQRPRRLSSSFVTLNASKRHPVLYRWCFQWWAFHGCFRRQAPYKVGVFLSWTKKIFVRWRRHFGWLSRHNCEHFLLRFVKTLISIFDRRSPSGLGVLSAGPVLVWTRIMQSVS